MTTYRLGTKQKRLWNPRLDKHYGKVCFYCKGEFLEVQHMIKGMTNPLLMEYDHLNDREYDNRIENIVKAHKSCNSKKRYDQNMKLMAMDQLRLNESRGIAEAERLEESPEEKENEAQRNERDEIYSNIEFMKITIEYLESNLQGDCTKLPYSSTVDSIAMLCFKRVGHGSPVSIRRTLNMLTSDEGDYYRYRDGGKQWLSKQNPLLSK